MGKNKLLDAVNKMAKAEASGTSIAGGDGLIEMVELKDPLEGKNKLKSTKLEVPDRANFNSSTAKQVEDNIRKFQENIANKYLDRSLTGIPQQRDDAILAMYGLKGMRDPSKSEVAIQDSTWNHGNIMTPFKRLPKSARSVAFKSNAHVKFQDSSLGGSFVINPKPQFTRYADVRANDLLYPFIKLNARDGKDNGYGYHDLMPARGLGRYYSESLDDNKQMVYLQFGVPKFNGLVSFFMNSVSYEDAYIATYARRPYIYQCIKLVTDVARWVLFPVISGLVYLGKFGMQLLVGNKPYMYYYLEPAMHSYWSTVNTVATHMGLSMGLLGSLFDHSDEQTATGDTDKEHVKIRGEIIKPNATKEEKAKVLLNGRGFKVNRDYVKKLNAAFGSSTEKFIDPDTGFVDVYYMATRHQQRANTILKNKIAAEEGKLAKDGSKEDLTGAIANLYSGANKNPDTFYVKWFDNWNIIASGYKEDMLSINTSNSVLTVSEPDNIGGGPVSKEEPVRKEGETQDEAQDREDNIKAANYANSLPKQPGKSGNFFDWSTGFFSWDSSKFIPACVEWFGKTWAGIKTGVGNLYDHAFATVDAVARGAASFLILQVNYTGGSSESFSNSTGEIQTGGAIKGFSQAMKHKRFSFSGGVTGIDIIDSITQGAMQVINGVLDSVTFGLSNVLRGLVLGSIVDMPKIWEDSSMSLPNVTYTMDLVSPYANPLSRFQNIIVPLATLLAGTLPIKAGKAAYTSPFLCSCYSKSVQHIRLGMITDLSITRGINNLAYCNDRTPNGITVSFTVTDFAPKLAAPINPTMWGNFSPIIEEETPLGDYFNVIGGRDLWDIEFYGNKLQYRIDGIVRNFHDLFRASRPSGALGEMIYNSPLAMFLPNPMKDLTETKAGRR